MRARRVSEADNEKARLKHDDYMGKYVKNLFSLSRKRQMKLSRQRALGFGLGLGKLF